MTGGFPCQPFSTVGKRQGQQDERGRGTLFGDIIRICEVKQPRYILLELNKYFTYALTKGQKSKIIFSKTTSEGDPVELAEVIYNPKGNTKTAKNETSIDHTYSFTVPQKPDIVLQLTRRDIETGFKLTYLFDITR